jgi:two-component system chemotaxis response regulator CheB
MGHRLADLNHDRRRTAVATGPFFDIVVIAASMGGVQALGEVLAGLGKDFPLPIVVVQHRTAHRPWLLHEVLGRKTELHVKYPLNGEKLLPGTVYIAPHETHLIIDPAHRVELTDHRRIRGVRPSANPLFVSAAHVFKNHVIAAVLTGGDSDATDGVQSVREGGGVVIAQDQRSSEVGSMPRAAVETGCVDYVLPLNKIAKALKDLVNKGSCHEPTT